MPKIILCFLAISLFWHGYGVLSTHIPCSFTFLAFLNALTACTLNWLPEVE